MRSRWRLVVVVAISAIALAACGGDDPTVPAGPTGGDVGAGETARVGAIDNDFAPASFAAPAGQEITVTVSNSGQNPHSFTIDSLDVDTGVMNSGDQAEVTFTMPDEEVEFYCTVHGAEVMSGTIDPA